MSIIIHKSDSVYSILANLIREDNEDKVQQHLNQKKNSPDSEKI